jgi:hypothetical protein
VRCLMGDVMLRCEADHDPVLWSGRVSPLCWLPWCRSKGVPSFVSWANPASGPNFQEAA